MFSFPSLQHLQQIKIHKNDLMKLSSAHGFWFGTNREKVTWFLINFVQKFEKSLFFHDINVSLSFLWGLASLFLLLSFRNRHLFLHKLWEKKLNMIMIRAWTPTCMTSYALSCSVFSFKARKLVMITYDLWHHQVSLKT